MDKRQSLFDNLKKPKLVFNNLHACGRVLKQASALSVRGWDLTWLSETYLPNSFKRQVMYASPKELHDALDLFNDKYLFVIHNEPSWMLSVIRNKFPKAKIIYEVHDSNYWRIQGDYTWYEDAIAADMCDGFVFPSKSAQDTYPLKANKKSIWLPSANPMSTYYYGGWDYMGGLVSEGGHMLAEEGEGNHWRDYTETYKQFKGKKQVFAYSAEFTQDNKELCDHYIDVGCKLGRYNHSDMISKLGRHDWGLVGNLSKAPVWDVALPNKAFDYLAGGVPLMNFNCPEVGKLIDKYDIGINVKSVDEAIARWDEHMAKRVEVIKHREKLSMDNFIPKLEKFYESITS